MDEKLDQAIENVVAKIRANVPHEEALKLSQAVLNLAQAKQLLAKGATKKAASAS